MSVNIFLLLGFTFDCSCVRLPVYNLFPLCYVRIQIWLAYNCQCTLSSESKHQFKKKWNFDSDSKSKFKAWQTCITVGVSRFPRCTQHDSESKASLCRWFSIAVAARVNTAGQFQVLYLLSKTWLSQDHFGKKRKIETLAQEPTKNLIQTTIIIRSIAY